MLVNKFGLKALEVVTCTSPERNVSHSDDCVSEDRLQRELVERRLGENGGRGQGGQGEGFEFEALVGGLSGLV